MSVQDRPRWRAMPCRWRLTVGLLVLLASAGAGLPGHGGPVRAVAVAAGHVVSGGFDGAAILWPEGLVLRGHNGAVAAVAVAEDGTVVTGGADGKILIWRDGRQVAALAGHEGPVAGLALRDGMIASASWDGTARLWAADGSSRVLAGHEGPVNAVAFTPEGLPVTAGYDGTIRVWRKDGGASVSRLGAPVNAVAVAGDGEIVAGGADGVLRLWFGDAPPRSLVVDSTPLTSLALSGDGRRIAVVSLGGSAVVVDRAGLSVTTVLLGVEHPLWAVAFDGNAVVTGGASGVVRRWEAASGRPTGSYGASVAPEALPAGDRGAQVFRACAACHSLSADGGGRAGPSLHLLFGRRVASLPGYAYSQALQGMDLVWSEQAVSDLFDRGPQAVTPGTKMPEQRIVDPADREALVRFLERATR